MDNLFHRYNLGSGSILTCTVPRRLLQQVSFITGPDGSFCNGLDLEAIRGHPKEVMEQGQQQQREDERRVTVAMVPLTVVTLHLS